jgi:hypothetical protein
MQINDAAVEKRARELCEQDGSEWDLEYKMPLPESAKPRLRPILGDEGRQKYLARARQQLLKDCSQNA